MGIGDNTLSWFSTDVGKYAEGSPRWFLMSQMEGMIPSFVSESIAMMEDIAEDLGPLLQSISDFFKLIQDLIPSYTSLAGFAVTQLIAEVERLILDLTNTGV